MQIQIDYQVTDFSDGLKQYTRSLSVPNYRTLRSLLSAIDAACREIEEARRTEPQHREGRDI